MLKKMKDKWKKNAASLAPQPRQLDEINKEFADLSNKAGQVQYQIYVFKDQLNQINQRLIAVNNEGAARKQLDAEAQAKQQVEVKDVQV